MRRACSLKDDTQNAILDAADRLIARFGYRKTTVEDVAREAGVGKGTIYLHFPGKEALALSIADRNNTHLREKLRHILRDRGSPIDRLRRMMVARVMFKLETAAHYGEALEELLADLHAAFLNHRGRWLAAEAGIFAELLTEGRILGVFDYDDALETAQTLLLTTSGLLPVNLTAQEMADRRGVEQRAERVANLVLSGLRRQPAPMGTSGTTDPSSESVTNRG